MVGVISKSLKMIKLGHLALRPKRGYVRGLKAGRVGDGGQAPGPLFPIATRRVMLFGFTAFPYLGASLGGTARRRGVSR